MSLMNEVEKLMNAVDASIDYRLINLGGKKMYIEGLKSVICFGENEMIFQLKKQTLTVLGSEFKVKYLDKTTCVLQGNITSVVLK